MAKKWFLILILLLAWLALAGAVTLHKLLLGAVLVMIAIWIDLKLEETGGWVHEEEVPPPAGLIDHLRRVLVAVAFVPIFLREVYLSALNVARHAVEIRSTIYPGIVRVPTRLRSKTAIVVLGNLITLTPGTLTMDFDEQEYCYYVHCIDATAEEDPSVIAEMEGWMRRIFE